MYPVYLSGSGQLTPALVDLLSLLLALFNIRVDAGSAPMRLSTYSHCLNPFQHTYRRRICTNALVDLLSLLKPFSTHVHTQALHRRACRLTLTA
jgi:hypothetical protein